MNSCGTVCSNCWSVGMLTALAVSITRETSAALTSLSLIATMPLELKLRMWLPAIPVYTLRILQSAINSASSSARWIDSTVASMLTTTPFFRPFDSAWPRPMTSWRPSDNTSATTATTFEVPMSRPTIRFFASFVISFRLFFLSVQCCQCQTIRFQRQTVRIAHVDIFNFLPLQAVHQLRIDGYQPGNSFLQRGVAFGTSQLDRNTVVQLHGPGIPVRQGHGFRHDLDRRQPIAELIETRHYFLLAAGRSIKLQQVAIVFRFGQIGGKHIALDRQQAPVITPCTERAMFFNRHDQLVRPFATHHGFTHPWHRFERATYCVQIGGKKIALDTRHGAGAYRQRIHAAQLLLRHTFDADGLEREHRP